MGRERNICTLCGGELEQCRYFAGNSVVTYRLWRPPFIMREDRLELQRCRDCGLLYGRKPVKDDE